MIVPKRILTALSVALIAACSGAVLLFSVSGTGWKALIVPTGSMRPTMPPGSLVIVHRVPTSSLKVGDVITYANPFRPSTTITHRLTKKFLIDGRVPGFVTKGDANKVADVPFAAGLVRGKAIWHVPYVGQLLLWAKRPLGLALLVYLPGLLIIVEEIRRLNDYFKLSQPYRLYDFRKVKDRESAIIKPSKGVAMAASLSVVFLLAGVFLWQPVLAAIGSNTVTIANNRISSGTIPNQNKCSGNTQNNTNVNVNNSTTQTATTGNATNSNNTNGGSATSGNATNGNSTSVTITITNCH